MSQGQSDRDASRAASAARSARRTAASPPAAAHADAATSRTVTISDVAHAAGVSRQTVSNVINWADRVQPETRERVRREIVRLGYRPSSAAQSLRNQRAGAVGFELRPHRRNDLVLAFLIELTLAGTRHGCRVVPFTPRVDQGVDAYDDLFRTNVVDAFVITDTHRGDIRPPRLAATGIPFVSFGQVWDQPGFSAWADVDGAAGSRMAVDHLVTSGYRRVAYLGWPGGSETGDDRRRGWAEATRAHDLHDPALSAESVQDAEAAAVAAGSLIDALEGSGAVVCASDTLATGVVLALHRRGLTPGTDIGVVGFDDSPLADALGITSLAQPLTAIADHLLSTLSGFGVLDPAQTTRQPPPDTAAVQGRVFSPDLALRASTDHRPSGR